MKNFKNILISVLTITVIAIAGYTYFKYSSPNVLGVNEQIVKIGYKGIFHQKQYKD